MKKLKNFIKWPIFIFGWAYIILVVLVFTFGCHKKQKKDPFSDVPDLPSDTVYVTRLVDRCNYQYLSLDPAKSKKLIAGMIKALDNLSIHNDTIIQNRMSVIRTQQAVIKTFPDRGAGQGS